MAFGLPDKKQSKRAVTLAKSTGEDALATVGEYLGIRKAPPVRTSGEDAVAFISGLLFGGLVVATVAILVAPTDGKTLRKRLTSKINELLGRNESDSYTSPFEPADTVTGAPASAGDARTAANEAGTTDAATVPMATVNAGGS